MKKQVYETPENYNSIFVNVTLSAKTIDGKYPLGELRAASVGNWLISEDTAKRIKYLYPVRRNKILGVFEVTGYHVVKIEDQERIQFDLKFIFEGSTRLVESAQEYMNRTNYVTKLFES